MTKIWVLVKMEGTSTAQDGHTVIGVYRTKEFAEADRNRLATTREPASWYEITEHAIY